jgi:hypothetical protein
MYLRLIGTIASGPIIGCTVAGFVSFAINRIMKKYDNLRINCDKCGYESHMVNSYCMNIFRCNCVPLYIKFLRLTRSTINSTEYDFKYQRRMLRNDIISIGIYTSPFISMSFYYCYTNPNVTFINMMFISGAGHLLLEFFCRRTYRPDNPIFYMLYGCFIGTTIKLGVMSTKYLQ